mgnify:CR=1 FL=1
MQNSKEDFILLAQSSDEESDLLDFKREYTPEKKAAFWAEIVKDIVAFANTRGGIIVFGVEDNGRSSGIDCSKLLELDNASLTDQIRKYTAYNFKGLSIIRIIRGELVLPAILVEPLSVPMVFTKVGTYEYEEGKQKTAFSQGTIYFRHGSKSEPCTRDDIAEKIASELERIREEWLGNIRKVVEAEPGSKEIVTQTYGHTSSGMLRITRDPNAPVARLPKLSDGYPHRQDDVIKAVNSRLKDSAQINTHDIQAIKIFESIGSDNSPQFMHKPHETSSPQYTEEFIDFIVEQFHQDEDYFQRCRRHWKQVKYP